MTFSEVNKNKLYSSFQRKGRINQCFFCRKKQNIIEAHSISENKCLSLLSERVNGQMGVYGFKHIKWSFNNWFSINRFGRFDIVGIKKASTFKGFCSKCDQHIFQKIDELHFDGKSQEQCFLYCYRSFAYAYHKQSETLRSCEAESEYKNENDNINDLTEDIKIGLMVDIANYPEMMNSWLQTKDYRHLYHFHCRTTGYLPLATASMCQPSYDINGFRLNDYKDIQTPLNHVFINIIPEEDYTHILISAFQKQFKAVQFVKDMEKMYNIDKEKFGIFLTTLLVFHTENTFMAPSVINELPPYAHRNLLLNLKHIITPGIQEGLLEKPIIGSLNLFIDKL